MLTFFCATGAMCHHSLTPIAQPHGGVERASELSEEHAMKLCHSSGTIGVGRVYFLKGVVELTDEGASQLVEDVLSLMRAFCTPLGDSLGAIF